MRWRLGVLARAGLCRAPKGVVAWFLSDLVFCDGFSVGFLTCDEVTFSSLGSVWEGFFVGLAFLARVEGQSRL